MSKRVAPVTLEQLHELPEPSWDMRQDELFVQFGCNGCPDKTCFVARGVTSQWPDQSTNPTDVRDLIELINEVVMGRRVFRKNANALVDDCETQCPEDIPAIVWILNNRFGADLKIPELPEQRG